MSEEKTTKLQDYIAGLRELDNPFEFPIGAVLVNEKERPDAVKVLKEEKLPVLEADQDHPDTVLSALVELIKRGKIVVLNVAKSLPPKIFNQLSNMIHGQINVQLAGQKKPTIVSPLSKEAKVVLVMTKDYYENLIQQDMISSVCRL